MTRRWQIQFVSLAVGAGNEWASYGENSYLHEPISQGSDALVGLYRGNGFQPIRGLASGIPLPFLCLQKELE